jgi:hypothetical protein
MPKELKMLRLIDRYGVEAVMGRPYLGAGEIMRMQAAETVVRVYNERKRYDDWTRHAREDPEGSAFLNRAMILATKMGLIDGR